jgi:RecJ-like exonuclease
MPEATCTCISCSACGGSGHIWFSFSGRYLGQHRSDDLDEMDTCEECRGRGLVEVCESCLDGYDEDWA